MGGLGKGGDRKEGKGEGKGREGREGKKGGKGKGKGRGGEEGGICPLTQIPGSAPGCWYTSC